MHIDLGMGMRLLLVALILALPLVAEHSMIERQ